MIRKPCWGIGLGRTGTVSFCAALRLLGYTRVGHNPEFHRLRELDGGADNGVLIFYKYLEPLAETSVALQAGQTHC
jgi:hypothetical protein